MHPFAQPVKRILSFFLFVAMFSAYAPVFSETAETAETSAHDVHHGRDSLDWPGIYYGLLPCDDCYGIKISLALNKNQSYITITQHMGKSPREFVEKGKFTWSEKDNTIVLTPRKGSATHQYLVGKDMLIKLDDNGNRISGKLADRYILRRTDVSAEPPQHSGH